MIGCETARLGRLRPVGGVRRKPVTVSQAGLKSLAGCVFERAATHVAYRSIACDFRYRQACRKFTSTRSVATRGQLRLDYRQRMLSEV